MLKFLREHSSQYNDNIYNVTKLPCRLLKTSQIQEFNDKHHLETCDYDKCAVKTNPNNIDYLRFKGLKLARRIEIEFYRKELEQILPKELYQAVCTDFSIKAKEECNRIGYEDFKNAPGLYEFVLNYIQDCQHNNNPHAIVHAN